MSRNSELVHLEAVLGPANKGAFWIPEHLLEDYRLRPKLEEAARATVSRSLPAVRAKYVADMMKALAADEPAPSTTAIAKALAEDAARTEARSALIDEIDSLQDGLVAGVTSEAEAIVTKGMAPAMADLMVVAQRCVADCGGKTISAEEALTGPPEMRSAFLELDACARKYTTIRRGQAALRRVMAGPKVDVDNYYFEVKLRPDLRKNWTNGRPPFGPADARKRIVWLVEHGHQVWVPLPREQDKAFVTEYPDSPAARGLRSGMAGLG